MELQNMGVVMDLSARTVSFMGYVAGIYDVDAATINFGGKQISDYGSSITIGGSIDRVTGHMIAETRMTDPNHFAPTFDYDVFCKATNRAQHPRMVKTNPNVATASANHWPGPVRVVAAICHSGSSNIRWAAQTPRTPPITCAPI
jgi:hypothetical protein